MARVFCYDSAMPREEKNRSTNKVEILTGIRPTGDLTVANYLGAVEPIVRLQNEGHTPLVFVADLHALTDSEPDVVEKYVCEVVADYIALGIDPAKTKIFRQSDIAGEVSTLTILLARLMSVAELLRVPTLKDKLKKNARPETANALLLLYPIMMAADILLQRAQKVPVGEDQVAHLEATRELAKRFNKKYGDVFPVPKVLQVQSLRILSLKGGGKMSKSSPEGALFLTDDQKTIARKIRGAQTAVEGIMNEHITSHAILAKGLCKGTQEQKEIDSILAKHKSGKPVMDEFKRLFTSITQSFVEDFQMKKKEIIKNPSFISSVLQEGADIARSNAQETLRLVERVMYRKSF